MQNFYLFLWNAAPGPVDEITGRCSVIVWKEPELPIGEIIKYKITLYTKDEEVDIETDSTQTIYVIESRAVLPKGSPIFVQVQIIILIVL